MSELGAFQDAFAAALQGDDSLSPWCEGSSPHRGLGVYRNTIAKGCVDALAENFPTVRALTGEEWFTGAALFFSRQSPPAHAALLDYGAAFPSWLEHWPGAGDLPYLAGVAHLDRLWIEALFAAEAPHLDAAQLASCSPNALAAARAHAHPSLRLAAFEAGVPGLWLAARSGEDSLELTETPQTVMLIRRAGAVRSRLLSDAEAVFLRATRQGETLGDAAEGVARTDPQAQIAPLFATLLAEGAFSSLDLETCS